ncbi:hypothetical protein JKP88DRAFT_242787 [Tribonema minus]|uniref:Uncharacterized protein n=1 Tax=Tribonema minus TaxID=303371 RepID=A0A836CQI1_9STRA|nr:hypothetical protein JKP88DRAFT_242787 [Tribonema minus]
MAPRTIVNGEIVDPESGLTAGQEQGSVSALARARHAVTRFRRRSVNLLGFAVPLPVAELCALLAVFWFGPAGLLLFGAVAAVSHFAFRDGCINWSLSHLSPLHACIFNDSGGSGGGGGGGGGGRRRDRAVMRGMKDLPQPPPSS